MIPIVAGLLMGAAMGGGIAALQKKDVLQGALMGAAGGALGGAFMPAAGGIAGTAAESPLAGSLFGEASSQAITPAFNAGIANPLLAESGASGVAGAAMEGGALGLKQGVLTSAAPAATTPGMFSGGIGNFISANKYPLLGGVAGGMMAGDKEGTPADTGNIYTTEFTQTRNPQFGIDPNASYFTQGYGEGSYSKASDYNPTMTAANGGIIALAEGGQALELEPYRPVETNRYSTPVRAIHPAVTDYNAQLLQRADQQYNKNLRPLPIQVPGTPGYVTPTFNAPVSSASTSSASTSTAPASTGEFGYNPVTRRYTGIGGLAKKEQTELEKMREEVESMRENQSYYNHAASNEGGANGGVPGRDFGSYADGGLSSLGAYSDGGQLLKGPGDGVSDDIPARIGARQPARLADGEFVVPARIVSEIGNGSTDAGAKRLYAMMDRVQKGRKKSIGKGKVAVDSKAHKMLPA